MRKDLAGIVARTCIHLPEGNMWNATLARVVAAFGPICKWVPGLKLREEKGKEHN